MYDSRSEVRGDELEDTMVITEFIESHRTGAVEEGSSKRLPSSEE